MNHFRLIDHFDTLAVVRTLHKLQPSTWKGAEARGEPDICTSKSVLLRQHDKPSRENWLEDLPLHDTDLLKGAPSIQGLLKRATKACYADPALKTVLDPVAPPGRAMLTALAKVNAIQWHTDNGPYHKRHVRFHIPLITNPACFLQVQQECVHLEVGTLWWFNNKFQHCAMNWGRSLRVHLIFEMPLVAKDDADQE